MTITIEVYRGSNSMFKIKSVTLSAVFIFAGFGCASISIENRSVPLPTPWDGVADLTLYNSTELSQRLDDGITTLELNIGNYSTSYRGLKILGIEAVHEPNTEIRKENFYLLFSVRHNIAQPSGEFFPWDLVLEISDLDGTNTSYFKPSAVHQAAAQKSCDFWQVLNQKTYPGEVVDMNHPISVGTSNTGEFNCFHFGFAAQAGFDNKRMSLNLSRALPSFKYKKIYFHPKMIEWKSSH